MFADTIRQAVQVCQRGRLAELSAALWKGYAAGMVAEDDAQAVAELIAARKAMAAPAGPVRRHVGSRPISGASIARRRRVASAGMMPPQLACRFTLSEASALSVIAGEVARRGSCELTVGEIAGRAGCCATVVRNAVREARRLGLIDVEVRRVAYDRNRTNVITLISAEWLTWLRISARPRDQGGGCRFAQPTQQIHSFLPESTRRAGWTAENSRGANRKVWANWPRR